MQDLKIALSNVYHRLKEIRRFDVIGMKLKSEKVHCWTDPKIVLQVRVFFKHIVNATYLYVRAT